MKPTTIYEIWIISEIGCYIPNYHSVSFESKRELHSLCIILYASTFLGSELSEPRYL